MALLDNLAPGMMLKGFTLKQRSRLWRIVRRLDYLQGCRWRLGSQLVYYADTDRFELAPSSLPWSFTADGAAFRLVSETYRIRLAYLFDPLIAVHISLIDPLPSRLRRSMRRC